MNIKFEFDVNNLCIISKCPECLYNELTNVQYKRLMYLLYDAFICLDDFYMEKKDGKQRKSKTKSRQKDIQKSSR